MDVFLARQPIFDTRRNAYGYEILYRSGYSNCFSGADADEATSKVIVDTFQTFGINTLTNGKPVFINFSERLIKEQVATLFSKDSLVIEILESVVPDDIILEKCQSLKRMGYTLALDDFVYKPETVVLLKYADIVKIDFLNTGRNEIERTVKLLKNTKVRLLAEKVESNEDFEYAKKLGFSLFQGFFFSKPEVMSSSRISPLKVNYLELMRKVNQAEINFDELAKIISKDLALTYNLLKLVNSAAFGLRSRITSVKHAIVIIGEKDIRKWVTLIALIGLGDDKPDELVRLSLIRARFAELISLLTPLKGRSNDLFLTGLFSLLDVVLNRPLSDILKDINTPEEVQDALLNKSGSYGQIYKLMNLYEKGQWEGIEILARMLEIDFRDLVDAYLNALKWYNLVTQDIHTTSA